MSDAISPPRMARWLLARRIEPAHREFLLGDLEEEFHDLRRRRGRLRAVVWYWSQALRSLRAPEHRQGRFFEPTSSRRGDPMQGIRHDLRTAIRSLRKAPGFTAVAVLTLALGIGANTAIFSVVNAVLIRPLPYPEPDELVRVWEVSGTGGTMAAAWRNFVDWRGADGFEGLVAHSDGRPATVLGGDEPLRLGVAAVSEGFFETLGVDPVRGRRFLPEEHREGADPAVVVSEGFWRTHLGSTTDLDDRRLVVSGYDARIVGVAPPGFDYPGGADVWFPAELYPQPDSRTAHNWLVVGRLAEGVTREQADQELDGITAGFRPTGPEAADSEIDQRYFPAEVRLEGLHEGLFGDTRRPLTILLAAAAVLLLVACTNLASTMLARGVERQRELAVRQALGAGRLRIVRELFAESALLSALGAVAGVVLAAATIRVLPALAPGDLPRLDQVRLDGAVLAFTAGAALATAVLFGLLPAFRSAGGDVTGVLQSGERGSSRGGRRPVWRSLIAAEVALALVLLIGSALLIRSLGAVLDVDPGYRTEGLLIATVNPPSSKYGDDVAKRAYYRRLLDELRALPGVETAGLVTAAPLEGLSNGRVQVRGGPKDSVSVEYQVVTADYFRALEIPLVRGRLFDERDHEGTEHVAVVNRELAELAWPGRDPIGRQITGGGMDNFWDQEKWARVVGVVEDVRQRRLTRPPEPTVYFDVRQRPYRTFSASAMIVPARGEPEGLIASVREAIRGVDADVPASFETIEERLRGSIGDRRFVMIVLGGFAVLALLLAAVGIYGVVAFSVARRTREVGIRVALGASGRQVVAMVVKEAMTVVALGLCLGLLGSLAATRLLQGLLYRVSAIDPVVYGVVALVLAAVAATAGWLPARRAARVNPTEAMRTE